MGNFGTNRKAALLRRKRERSFHWAFYLSIPLPFPSLNATCRVQCASPYLPLGEWTQGVQVLCAGKTSQNNVDHLGEQAGEQKVAFLHPIVYWIFHTKFLESWRDNICWLLCLSSISGYFKYCLITYNSPPMVS